MRNAIFLAFNDKFFVFARNCINSIKRNYPNHPEILAYYDGRDPNVLKFLTSIDNLDIRSQSFGFMNLEGVNLGRVNSKQVYFRFILWTDEFDDYDTIVHLDADTIVLKPFDSLFDGNDFFAVDDYTPFGFTLFETKYHTDKELSTSLKSDGIIKAIPDINMLNAGVFAIPRKYRNAFQFTQLWTLTQKYNRLTSFADQASISLWCHANGIPFSDAIQYNFQLPFVTNQVIFFSEIVSKDFSLSDIKIFHFTWWKPDTVYYNKCKELVAFLKMLT